MMAHRILSHLLNHLFDYSYQIKPYKHLFLCFLVINTNKNSIESSILNLHMISIFVISVIMFIGL